MNNFINCIDLNFTCIHTLKVLKTHSVNERIAKREITTKVPNSLKHPAESHNLAKHLTANAKLLEKFNSFSCTLQIYELHELLRCTKI